MTEQLLHNWI